MHPSGGMEYKLTEEAKGNKRSIPGAKWWLR